MWGYLFRPAIEVPQGATVGRPCKTGGVGYPCLNGADTLVALRDIRHSAKVLFEQRVSLLQPLDSMLYDPELQGLDGPSAACHSGPELFLQMSGSSKAAPWSPSGLHLQVVLVWVLLSSQEDHSPTSALNSASATALYLNNMVPTWYTPLQWKLEPHSFLSKEIFQEKCLQEIVNQCIFLDTIKSIPGLCWLIAIWMLDTIVNLLLLNPASSCCSVPTLGARGWTDQQLRAVLTVLIAGGSLFFPSST